MPSLRESLKARGCVSSLSIYTYTHNARAPPHPFVCSGNSVTSVLFFQHLSLLYDFLSIINGELRLINTILSLSALLCSLGVSIYAIREMRSAKASIPSLDDFVWEEEGQWVMDARLGSLIDAFGSRIAKSLKMSFLQGLGAQTKIEKGLKSAITADIIDQKMPLLNLAADFLGINVKQYITKHPEAIVQLIPMFQGFMQKNHPGTNQGVM